jgi:hypothetical protein
MPMMLCMNCLNDMWEYKQIEDTIEATCRNCGYERSWNIPAKKLGPKQPGDPCRCKEGVTEYKEKKVTEKNLKKSYHYKGFLECLACGKKYYREEDKVFLEGQMGAGA